MCFIRPLPKENKTKQFGHALTKDVGYNGSTISSACLTPTTSGQCCFFFVFLLLTRVFFSETKARLKGKTEFGGF